MMDANAYAEIQQFAEGLITCINIRENSEPKVIRTEDAFGYFRNIISLHLSLKEADLDAVGKDMEETYKRA